MSGFLNPRSKVGQFLSILGLSSLITPVRVKSIILNESHPRFKELGEWSGLGIIEFDFVTKPSDSKNQFPIAKPLLSNIKNFPLINEIVYIMSLPSSEIGEATTATELYYINIISIWNHPHHNAYPENPGSPSQQQLNDYDSSFAGDVRRVTDASTEINLGSTFKEKANIHPLLPFEGDVIHEGRWGNSIRLGSTVKSTPNNWSSEGNDGDPITIIRNGQGGQTPEGWIPVTEDINNDDSSVYLTQTQNIPLNASSVSYNSYKQKPTSPKEFSGKQIILNSGRLVFNSANDHILLSSAKTINLNSLESINIDTKDTIIQTSGKIYLADKNASQQALLGNKTVDFLTNLLNPLNKLAVSLIALAEVLPVTPQVGVNTAAAELTAAITRLLPQITILLSQDVYIKDNGIPLVLNPGNVTPQTELQIRSQEISSPLPTSSDIPLQQNNTPLLENPTGSQQDDSLNPSPDTRA